MKRGAFSVLLLGFSAKYQEFSKSQIIKNFLQIGLQIWQNEVANIILEKGPILCPKSCAALGK